MVLHDLLCIRCRYQGGPEEAAMLSQLHPQELRDRYIQIKEDYFNLKRVNCRQTDELKRTQTRVQKLEEDLRKGLRSRPVSAPAHQATHEQREIQEFQETAISQLSYRNELLERKLKMANIHLNAARQNKTVLYRSVGPRVDSWLRGPPLTRKRFTTPPPSRRSVTPINYNRARTRSLSPKNTRNEAPYEAMRQLALQDRVSQLLEDAKERITSLEAARAGLQKDLQTAKKEQEAAENNHATKVSQLEGVIESMRDRLRASEARVEDESTEAVMASRELRRLETELTAAQERCSTAEEMLRVERQRRKEFISELDQLRKKHQEVKEQLLSAQTELKALQNEREEFVVRIQLFEREVGNLQGMSESNLRLSRPFHIERTGVSADQSSVLRARIEELEQHLQEEANSKETLLGQLQETVGREKQQVERMHQVIKEAELLRRQVADLQKMFAERGNVHEHQNQERARATSLAERGIQCVLMSPADTLIKSQQKERQGPASLQLPDDRENLKQLENKLARLENLYTATVNDLQEANTHIHEQNQAQKELVHKLAAMSGEFEAKERRYTDKINSLTGVIRAYEEKLKNRTQSVNPLSQKQNEMDPAAHLSQSLKFGRRDCRLEIFIDKAIFDLSAYDDQKTFVSWIMPFTVEDPLQHTDLALGSIACYSHTSIYKIHVKSLGVLQETISVGMYVLLDGEYPGKVGEGVIPLSSVLHEDIVEGTSIVNPVVHAEDTEEYFRIPPALLQCENKVLATLSYRLRLTRPSGEIASRGSKEQLLRTEQDLARKPSAAEKVVFVDHRDYQQKISLRRQLQHLKRRHGSIQETEDEETEADEALKTEGETVSETESEGYVASGILLKSADHLQQERISPHDYTDEGSQLQARTSREPQDVYETEHKSSSHRKSRPTSSKSYKIRKKKSTAASSRSLHRSLETLPRDDVTREPASPHMQETSISTRRRIRDRPHSAPRKDRELYHSTTPTSSDHEDSIVKCRSKDDDDSLDDISYGNKDEVPELSAYTDSDSEGVVQKKTIA